MSGGLHRLIVSVAVLITAAGTSFAQVSFVNTPQDTIVDNIPLESAKVLDFKQQAVTFDTLHLAWQQVSLNQPSQWETFLCDNGTCYTNMPLSGSMYPVPPADYGLLSLHIKPRVNFGTAIIQYAVWDLSNPAQKDTLTWVITSNTTGIKTPSEDKPQVYTNHKILFIKNLNPYNNSIVLYDLTGKKVLQQGVFSEREKIDLNSIDDGIYIIEIIGGKLRWAEKIFVGN